MVIQLQRVKLFQYFRKISRSKKACSTRTGKQQYTKHEYPKSLHQGFI